MNKIVGLLVGAIAYAITTMVVGSFADSQALEIGAGFVAGIITFIIISKSN